MKIVLDTELKSSQDRGEIDLFTPEDLKRYVEACNEEIINKSLDAETEYDAMVSVVQGFSPVKMYCPESSSMVIMMVRAKV